MATVVTDPNKKNETAPTSNNAVAAQQQRVTSTESAPATPANAGMQAAVDAINAAASPAAASSLSPTGTQAVAQNVAQANPNAVSQNDVNQAQQQAQQAQAAAQQARQQAFAAGQNLSVGTGFDANATLQNINGMLTQLLNAQGNAANAKIDFGVQQGVSELQRAEEDAQADFQTQRNQIAIDEAKALDNSALYAEARGDRGGIGQTQYTLIQLNAAKNRLAVNQAQTKLSTDTARQIADLRAQGEFNKADALLDLTQSYLSSLMSSYQWATELGFTYEQYQQELAQWEKEYALSYANITGYMPDGSKTLAYQQYEQEQAYQKNKDEQSKLSDIGSALLSAGVMPSAEQLAAMGLTKGQAQDYITAQGLTMYDGSGKGSGGGGSYSEEAATKQRELVAAGYNVTVDGIWGNQSQTAWDQYQAAGKKNKDTGDTGRNATAQYVGNGKTQIPITSVSYNQDEGVITWNGKTYTSTNAFINAVNTANRKGTVTDAQAKQIQANMNRYLPASKKI